MIDLIPIRDTDPVEPLQEFPGMAGIPGSLVFVQDNLPVRVHLAGTVYPHVTLAPGISPVFIYQHGRLIRLQDSKRFITNRIVKLQLL